MLSLHNCDFDKVINGLEKFIYRAYCPKSTLQPITSSLVERRYFLYKKFSSEINKVPPTPGAFLQHFKRACFQLVIWFSAYLPEAQTVDNLTHGWELNEMGDLMPVCTLDRVARDGLIELVSCKCKGDCTLV